MDRRLWAEGLIFLGGATLKTVAAVRGLTPPTLFTHFRAPARSMELPMRVTGLIGAQEEDSERLIVWRQLTLAAIIATLYLIAPRPLDAQFSMLMLAGYAAFTSALGDRAYDWRCAGTGRISKHICRSRLSLRG